MVKEVIEKHINKQDYIYGFANLKGLLPEKYSDYKYGIVIGKNLDNKIMDSISNGPNEEYFNLYKNTNSHLFDLTKKIETDLKNQGVEILPISPTLTDETRKSELYVKHLKTDLSHKFVATRAGLGWIGKTALFISYKFGPRLRLVSMLTNYNLKIKNAPIDISECGKCNVCVDKCPSNAANGKLWNTELSREGFFDAFKCKEQCNSYSNITVCGICVSVCPKGKNNKKK